MAVSPVLHMVTLGNLRHLTETSDDAVVAISSSEGTPRQALVHEPVTLPLSNFFVEIIIVYKLTKF